MTITEHDSRAASALVQLSSPVSHFVKHTVRSLPSPTVTDDESLEDKIRNSEEDERRFRPIASGKRLPRVTAVLDYQPEPTEEDLHLTIGKSFLDMSETQKSLFFTGFRALTSITSPALLPWHIMCLSNLKVCTINVDVETRSLLDFAAPGYATIHDTDDEICHIEKLIGQMPIEALNDSWSDYPISKYLPTVVDRMPNLRHLALQLARTATYRQRTSEVERAYDFLLSYISSKSVEALLIDICDIELGAVRHCHDDFFENILPLTSLDGFPNLRRIVAPQEAFIRVSSNLSTPSTIECVPPTVLLPGNIKSVEIIDSTSALTLWADKLLNA